MALEHLIFKNSPFVELLFEANFEMTTKKNRDSLQNPGLLQFAIFYRSIKKDRPTPIETKEPPSVVN